MMFDPQQELESVSVLPLNSRSANVGLGYPLVLIHGVGESMDAWDQVVSVLEPQREVIRYDLRGHGESPTPPGPYSLKEFVADHVAVLERYGRTRVDVAGFSLGGLIAQAVAVRHPETVRKLAIVGSFAGRSPAELHRARQRLAAIENGGPAAVAEASEDRWFTEAFRRERRAEVDRAIRRLSGTDPNAYAAAYRVLVENDLVDELGAIDAPTLVIAGENDIGAPPHMAMRMARKIPDARLAILRDVQHGMLTEVPARIAAELSRFLEDE
jgi:3-oxoadipate enol-lactonase